MATPDSLTELPRVVDVPDQPCQQLYEGNPVLLGFDVVYYHQIPSYDDGGIAQQGSPGFAYNFNGYQFWFISEANRNLFIGDPWRYAPAWGGFCSFGIALERKPQWPWEADFLGPPASPWEGWKIINGTLTFNIWASYTDRFMENAATNMELAAQRWKEMFDGELRAGPFNTHCIGHGTLKNWCLTQQPSPWLEPLPECGDSTTTGANNGVGNHNNNNATVVVATTTTTTTSSNGVGDGAGEGGDTTTTIGAVLVGDQGSSGGIRGDTTATTSGGNSGIVTSSNDGAGGIGDTTATTSGGNGIGDDDPSSNGGGDGGATTTTASATTSGSGGSRGGIVSNLDSYEDFAAPSDLSPYQRRWIRIGVPISVVVAVGILLFFLFCRRSRRRRRSGLLHRRSKNKNNNNTNVDCSSSVAGSSSGDDDAEEQSPPVTTTKS